MTFTPPRPLVQVACAALIATLGWSSAQACSVKDVVRPQELVQEADGIYHVRAAAYRLAPEPGRAARSPEVRFDVIAVVKGPELATLHLSGVLVDKDDYNEQPVPYDFVRSAGRHGNCFATQYRKGGEFLLLLKSGTPHWSPLAPTNEQIRGESDAWLAWVKDAVARKGTPNGTF